MEQIPSQQYYDEYEIDLRELLILLWNNKWFIITLFVITVVAAFFISGYYMTPIYETETTIQLSNIKGIYSQSESAQQILKNGTVIKPILEKNSKEEFTQARINNYIENNISINKVENTQILNMKIKNSNPQSAKAIAQKMIDSYRKKASEHYTKFINQKQEYLKTIEDEIKQTDEKIEEMNQQITNIEDYDIDSAEKNMIINSEVIKLDYLQRQKSSLVSKKQKIKSDMLNYHFIEVLKSPYVPENPVSPNTKLNVAIAGVLAIMLGVFIVLFREFMKGD